MTSGRTLPIEQSPPSAPDRGEEGHRSRWWVVPVALALSLVVGWYTPAVLYANNTRQFEFALRQVLPLLAVPMLVVFAALAAFGVILPRRARRFYMAGMAAGVGYIWIAGFLVVSDYGQLDGSIELPAFRPVPIVAIALVLLVAMVVLARVRPSLLGGTAVVLVLAQLGHIGGLVVSDPNPSRAALPPGAEELYDLGPRNVIVVLLDALQSDIFAEAVERRPDLAAGLDGFTYYPNTLGVGRNTYGSLPTIHSGRTRQVGESMDEHFRRSIASDSFESELADAGWSVVHLNPVGGTCPGRVDGCFTWDPTLGTRAWDPVRRQAEVLLDLTLFRLAPPVLKAKVYDDDRWLIRRTTRRVSLGEASDTLIRDFARKVRRSGRSNALRFLHLQSTHAPGRRAADCSLLPKPVSPITRPVAVALATCAVTRVVDLARSLRTLGADDSTALVVLSDHGYRDMPSPRVTDPAWSELIGLANPLLAVKGPGASGPMRTSDAQMSLADVRAVICAFAADCGDPGGDPTSPDAHRRRSFTMYDWGDEFWHASTLKNERRYDVQGPMFDPDSWTDLGPLALPEIDRLTFGADDRNEHFGFGWRPATDDGRWAVGRRASLNLNLPRDAAVRLEFDVRTLPELVGQRMRVDVNGITVGDEPVRVERSTLVYEVPVGGADRDLDEVILTFSAHADPGPDGDRHARLARSTAVRFEELRIQVAAAGQGAR